MSRAKRVLIVSVKAGAGHLRAAEAIEAALREKFPRLEVRNIEALAYTNASFRKSFTGTYNQLVTRLPSVWGMIYGQLEKKPADSRTKKLAALFDRLNSRPLLKVIKEFDPDRIVCTHYLPAEILGARSRRGKLRASLYVTLTDYDIHTMWIQEGVDHYFVATDEMAHALRAKGVGAATVSVTGIPIVPVFAAGHPDKRATRRKLRLRVRPKTVIVAAGGFGMTRLDRTVADIADRVADVQFLAVAGRNEKLRKQLAQAASTRTGKIVPFGFVTNMHELMAASDFVITKCGGLTSSECLAMNLPMIILSPIPGQEERNSDYLLESGVALRANSAAHLVYKTRKLLADDKLLGRMRTAARRIAKPRAAYDVAEQVVRGG